MTFEEYVESRGWQLGKSAAYITVIYREDMIGRYAYAFSTNLAGSGGWQELWRTALDLADHRWEESRHPARPWPPS